ncbi:hypothetical protein BH18ACI3_BH18ACI3_14040 [soil metagenome]
MAVGKAHHISLSPVNFKGILSKEINYVTLTLFTLTSVFWAARIEAISNPKAFV